MGESSKPSTTSTRTRAASSQRRTPRCADATASSASALSARKGSTRQLCDERSTRSRARNRPSTRLASCSSGHCASASSSTADYAPPPSANTADRENPTFLHLLSDLDPPPGHHTAHTAKAGTGRDNTVTHASLPRISSVAGIAANRGGFRLGEMDPPSPKWLVRQFAGTAAGRMDEQTDADPADFISPSDLAKAQPFSRIGTMQLDRGKWRATVGPSAS